MREIVAAILAICALTGAAGPPPPPRGLPEGWTMTDDAGYAPADRRWRYKPAASRRGTYAHGAHGEAPIRPESEVQAAREQCYHRNGNFPFSDAPEIEYWYYEAEGEALLLLKSNAFSGVDAACKPVLTSEFSVERAVIGPAGFTRFEFRNGGWHGETRSFAEYRLPDYGDIAIGALGPPMVRFLVRKRHLGESDVGPRIGKVQTHCVGYSSPPDGGGQQCWIAGGGPGAGIITFDVEYFAGSPEVSQQVTDLEDGVAIDGRLFEWDRTIGPPGT